MSVPEDALHHHLYEDIYTAIHLLLYLLASLRSEILQPSIFMSLQSELLRLSLLVSLRSGSIWSSLLVSLGSGIIRSSPLASLQNKFILASPMTSLRKIFLRRLYEGIPTVTPIPSKPGIFLQYIRGFIITSEYVKPESPESWIPSHSSLQPYMKYFYKFVTYYMFDHNYNIDTCDIRRQIVGYIMSLKRKQGAKLKTKGYAEGYYHRIFNNVLESSSNLLQTNTHRGCSVLNTTDYNYKLRSVIG